MTTCVICSEEIEDGRLAHDKCWKKIFACPGQDGTPDTGPCPYWDTCRHRITDDPKDIHPGCQHVVL